MNATNALQFFVEITDDMSKLIIFNNLLTKHCQRQTENDLPTECQNMVRVLKEHINTRFANIEENLLLAEATSLDLRFKKQGFQSEQSFEKAKQLNKCATKGIEALVVANNEVNEHNLNLNNVTVAPEGKKVSI